MATYTFLGGASFDDPNNWYNVTAGKPDDGVPGPDDTMAAPPRLSPARGKRLRTPRAARASRLRFPAA